MEKKRLFLHIYPYFLAVTILSVAVAVWFCSSELKKFYISETEKTFTLRAEALGKELVTAIDSGEIDRIASLCSNFTSRNSSRITIIKSDGKVIFDSEKPAESMENHANRPEIITALGGNTGKSIRYSATLRMEMLYVAVPILSEDGKISAVMRISIPLSSINSALAAIYWKLAFGSLIIFLLTAVACIFVSRSITRPIRELLNGVRDYSSAASSPRLAESGIYEIDELGSTLNMMSENIEAKIREISGQNSKVNAIFSSMLEGVIAFDANEKIISVNAGAISLLGMPEKPEGRLFQEVVRYSELQNFASKVLAGNGPVESELVICSDGNQTYLQARGTVLMESDGKCTGGLVVLNDITKIKMLENMRRDFVANVSHEIKTPLTAIKGSVETILDGAIDKRKETKHFVKIIAKHAERLNSLVEDILDLSKIEQASSKGDILFSRSSLPEIIRSACELCAELADAKNITMAINCDEDIEAVINSNMIEQAIVNLMDNAIKYSEEGSSVRISCGIDGTQSHIFISVQDKGTGISEEHLPRLFERFYRVDKARSRNAGGTGLGLAIVKHIVNLHKGTVEVKSRLGEGSTFTIRLPG